MQKSFLRCLFFIYAIIFAEKTTLPSIQGDAKLNEAIMWNINGLDVDTEGHLTAGATSDALTIKGHMKEDAGNEYQGLSIDGIAITVVATQYTYEYDSNDNQYDANATYLNTDADGNILIGSAGDLRYFAATVNADNSVYAGKTIKLTSDIDLGGAEWTPINWQNKTGFTFDGNGKTISNFTVKASKFVKGTGFFGTANWVNFKNLTIDNATVEGFSHVGAIVGHGMCTTIEGCTVKNSNITTSVYNGDEGDKAGAIAGWLDEGTHGAINCTVDNCTVTGYRDIGGLVGYAGNGSNSTATVTGNTVKNTNVVQNLDNDYQSPTPTTVEQVVGRYYTGLDLTGNRATNVTIK